MNTPPFNDPQKQKKQKMSQRTAAIKLRQPEIPELLLIIQCTGKTWLRSKCFRRDGTVGMFCTLWKKSVGICITRVHRLVFRPNSGLREEQSEANEHPRENRGCSFNLFHALFRSSVPLHLCWCQADGPIVAEISGSFFRAERGAPYPGCKLDPCWCRQLRVPFDRACLRLLRFSFFHAT